MGFEKLQANWEGPYVVIKARDSRGIPSPDTRRRALAPPMKRNQLKAILSIKVVYENIVARINE